MSMHNEVLGGFARAIWTQAFAQAVEEMVEDGRLAKTPWKGGDKIDAFTPWAPDDLPDRVSLLFDASMTNFPARIEEAYVAARGERYDAPRSAGEFGWQIGMAWVGHGSAIGDAGRVLLKQIGHGEMSVTVKVDNTGAPSKAEVASTNLPSLPTVEANRARRASKRRFGRRTSRRGSSKRR